MTRPSLLPARRLLLGGALGLLTVLSCGRDVTGPEAVRVVRGFAFDARFANDLPLGIAGELVSFTRVRVVLVNTEGRRVVDRLVPFPSNATEVPVSIDVPLTPGAPSTGEQMQLSLDYLNAAGDTVFRGGPLAVQVAPRDGSEPPAPPQIPVTYTGPGAEAVSVTISPNTLLVTAGDPFAFTAVAENAQQQAVATAPIAWYTLDSTKVTLSAPGAGNGTTLPSRGPARIVAQLLTGAADTVTMTIAPRAQVLERVSGDNQNGTQGAVLAAPVVVRVRATDGLAMQGVPVTFVAGQGGSVGTASVITDFNGLAQTSWTLGTGLGAQTLTASVAGVTGSPLTFTAQTPTVVLLHHYPINGSLVDAVGGVDGAIVGNATLTDGVLGLDGTSYAEFPSAIVPAQGSYSVSLFVRSRTSLAQAAAYLAQGSAGGPGFGIGQSASGVLRVPETWGNTTAPAPGIDALFHHVVLVVDSVANQSRLYVDGSLQQTLNNRLEIGAAGSPTRLGVTFGTLADFFDGDIDEVRVYRGAIDGTQVVALNTSGVSAPGRIVFAAQPTDVAAGAVITPAVTVRVEDAQGRLNTSFTGAVSIGFGNNPSGATLGGTTTVNAVAGVATFSTLTVPAVGAGYTLEATSAGVAAVTSTPFNVTSAAATQLAWTVPPSTGLAGAALTPALVGEARDAGGNLATTFTGTVTLAFGANPAGATLQGTLTASAVGGVATFSDVRVSAVGTGFTLVASASGLSAATSGSFAIGSGVVVNAWANASGGNWSVPTNWSLGRVPELADSVVIALDGTYTVTLDVNFAGSRVTVGGGTGVKTLNGSSRTLTMSTALAVEPGGALLFASSTVNGTGTLTNNGTVTLTGTTLAMALVNNATVIGAGISTISGAVSTSATSLLRAFSSNPIGGATLTVTNGFTNNGTIQLEAIDAGYTTTFTVTNGTLTNALGGVIRPVSGTGSRILNAQLANAGLVDVQHALTINRASAAHTNTGTIAVDAATLTIAQTGTTPSFTNTGSITITAGRILSVTGGTLDLTGGTLSGPAAQLSTSGTTLAFTTQSARTRLALVSTTVPGTFTIPAGDSLLLAGGSPTMTLVNNGRLVFQATTSFTGSLTTGDTTSVIELRSSNAYGGVTTTFTNGFTNAGLIELRAVDAGYTTTLAMSAGTLVNAPGGIIRSVPGTGARVLNAQLDNQGLLHVPYGLSMTRASATHTNSGAIDLSTGDLSIAQSGTTPSFTNTGVVSVAAGRTLTITGGAADFSAGAFNGPSATLSTSGVTMTLNNATARTRFALANTTVSNPITIPAGDSLRLVLGSPTMNITNNGRLIFQSSTTYNGTITTGGPTSEIEVRSSNVYGGATTTFTNGFTNTGLITLTVADAGYTSTLAVSNGTLTNEVGGIIRSVSGPGARVLNAQLDNRGLLDVAYPLTISRPSSAHVNSGTIDLTGANLTLSQSGTTPSFTNTGAILVPTGRTMSVTGGVLDLTAGTFDGPSGTLNTSGTTLSFNINTVRTNFTLATTTVPGTFTIPAGDSLRLAGGSPTMDIVNNGRLVFQNSTTYNGTITTGGPSSEIEVRSSNAYGGATTTFANGFTNTGLIRLTVADAGYTSTLAVTNGTLINEVGGIIRSVTGPGARTLNAQLDNRGLLDVAYPLTIGRPSSAHVNSGTIDLTLANLTLNQSGTTPSFTNTGTILVPTGRTMSVSGGVLDLTAGLFDGPSGTLNTSGTTLSFNINTVRTNFTLATTTVPGTFTIPAGDSLRLAGGSPTMDIANNGRLIFQNSTTYNGTITTGGPSSEIEVRSSNAYGGATTTFANGFTNTGLIRLTVADAGYTSTLNVSSGTLINEVGGIIRSVAGPGARTLNAQLDNRGLLDVAYPLTINRASATHVNSGSIALGAGNLTVTQSGTTPSFTNTGTITAASGLSLTFNGGAVDMTSGLVDAPAARLFTSSATFNFTVPTVRSQLTLTATTVPGTLTIPAGDSLRLVAGSPTMTIDNLGRLILQGTTSLGGSLTSNVGSEIEVRSSNAFGGATATFSNAFTNNGLLRHRVIDAGYTGAINFSSGTFVNSASGSVSFEGTTGSRTMTAPAITNNGDWQTVLTNTITGPITQNGTLTVPSGTLTLNSLLTLNSPSITTINGTLVKNGSCTNTGGTITGSSPTATCP
ncbi:MAG: hypothetical protein IT357_16520 [Gemmatimonadaceae bacterium]|nr:hypothetical protein [Gemmatimonadaceae bacterium]